MRRKLLNHRGHEGHREINRYPLRTLCSLWFIVFLFAACIPAQTPPILDATPAAGVSVTDDIYRSEAFSLRYPSGWRVITSQAGAPPSVTLVEPGNCALIVVSSTPIETPPTSSACAEPDIETISHMVGDITLAGSAPAAAWEPFLVTFEQVAASLSTP